MIKSMTGFGKAVADSGNKSISVEVRALNSKQFDLNTRLPQPYRDREMEIRLEAAKILERGKVDVVIIVDNGTDPAVSGINRELFRKYFLEIKTLAAELQETGAHDIVNAVLQIPEVLRNDRESMPEEEWNIIRKAIQEALHLTDEFRIEEGKVLEADIRNRIGLIVNMLEEIKPFEKMRIISLRERFERNKEEFISTRPGIENFDENRFEQEIFWYLEKLDITEEMVRLRKHCDYFLECLGGNISNGRKLGFISQELGREINTIGSKASHAEIQKLVVQMKDELEKIKEQLGNIL